MTNPTNPTNPDRPTSPTVREIAALTARLREISTRGRNVDEAERAAFLTDKDALIARITHADTNADNVPRGDDSGDRTEQLQDRPWTAQGRTADTAHFAVTDHEQAGEADGPPWLVMPAEMRERAGRVEAGMNDQTARPTQADDPAEIAARVEVLRERIAARFPDPPTDRGDADRVAMPMPWHTAVDTEDQEQRREQLTRWHTDDTAPDADAVHDGDGPGAGAGWYVCDDAPGLP